MSWKQVQGHCDWSVGYKEFIEFSNNLIASTQLYSVQDCKSKVHSAPYSTEYQHESEGIHWRTQTWKDSEGEILFTI